jgi:predicted MPP superfamily phosphohydrolase
MGIITAILAIVLAATWFAAWTFAHLAHLSGWAWIALPLLLIGGFVPTTLLGHRTGSPLLRPLIVICGISFGSLTYFLTAAIACWIAVGASSVLGIPIGHRALAFISYGAAALVGLFSLFLANWLRVTRVTVALPNLPAFWKGRTLALVSDVHLGNFRQAAFSRKLVSRLMSLHSECILVAGDMFDGAKFDVERAVRPWAALSAPSGVYFAGGNHDDYGGRIPYFEALRSVGMRVLDNERIEIHGLQLVGVHDEETHEPEAFRAILEKARVDPASASILLAHRPSNLSVPEQAGISLQLSGHTHGGQFWPWTLIVKRVHGEFAYGLNRFGRLLVFTTSGAGTWGPPFRLGTRSEIVLVRLETK